MFYCGFDTDDLTDRQNNVFHKLKCKSKGIDMLALNFISFCVKQNCRLKQFNNYKGDCDYLLHIKRETLEERGIDLDTIYN